MTDETNKPSAAAMRAADAVYKSLQPHTGWQDQSSHDWAVMADIIDAEFAPVVEALRKLANESRGFLGMSLDSTHGITNKRILSDRIDQALSALEGK